MGWIISGAAGTSAFVEVGDLILLAHAQCPDKSNCTPLPHILRNYRSQTAIKSGPNQHLPRTALTADPSIIGHEDRPSASHDDGHSLVHLDVADTSDAQLEHFISEMDVQDPFDLVYGEGFGAAGNRRESDLSEFDFSDILDMPDSKRIKCELMPAASDMDASHDG